MKLEKIEKLLDKKSNTDPIAIIYFNKKYYLKLYFNNKKEFINLKMDKVYSCLMSNKSTLKPYGLGRHKNKYVWIQNLGNTLQIFLTDSTGGLKGDEIPLIYPLGPQLTLNELIELSSFFCNLESTQNDFFDFLHSENLLD